MASSDWLPARDADLLSFASNFSTKITASPVTYGLLAADATALAALVTAYSSALAIATTPATRTKPTVSAKDIARADLVADIRSLARRIQATPTVTPPEKDDLGLPVHDNAPTPIPPPATRPLVNLMTLAPLSHTIRLADETTPTRRARPSGTAGAQVYVFIGDNPPVPPGPGGDMSGWTFKGLATRGDFDVAYEIADAGKQSTVIARWCNRKGEAGPVSTPISGTIAA